MKVRRISIVILSCCWILPSLLLGQMAGNPIGSRGEGEWTVSVFGNYYDIEQGHERAVSKRAFLKSN